jgi:hypothetical protein
VSASALASSAMICSIENHLPFYKSIYFGLTVFLKRRTLGQPKDTGANESSGALFTRYDSYTTEPRAKPGLWILAKMFGLSNKNLP